MESILVKRPFLKATVLLIGFSSCFPLSVNTLTPVTILQSFAFWKAGNPKSL